MIKKLTLLLVLLISSNIIAQVTNEGTPKSWKQENIQKSINTIKLPSFDLKALQNEDLINDKLPMPWRFGNKFDVNYGFEDGQWNTLENGDRIWRINFTSKDALALNIIFDQFYMPEGAKVYLYNDDRSDLLGAYTASQNQESQSLGTWLVKGANLWIEYFEPANVANQGKLHIGSITHSYRNAQTYKDAKALNDSGDCNHDVDCPIGADWEDHKDNNKKSVGILLSGGSGFCTGALVNNTANDQKGYFLTANHCFSNPANWAFRFGWISPNPVCAATTNSTNGPTNFTLSGATLRARNANTDFALVEINPSIPSGWDITWAGWDNSDINPDFVVGIHHPSGDIMKICRDNTGVIKRPNAGAQTWEITTAGGGWELGVTEPGSSGSPLFDDQGKIIGQLFGGAAACSGTNDNGTLDYYGRFGLSWDAIAGNTNQLQPWLDPTNSGVSVLESFPPLETFNLDAGISVNIPDIDCGVNQVSPVITLRNAGSTTLTSATITWNNGGADTTIDFSGSLDQNETQDYPLGTMTITGGSLTINASVSNPNGSTDDNDTNDTATSEITIDGYITTQVHLDLLTDLWAQETSWEFLDSSGTVIASFGPYQEDVDDETHFFYDFDVDPNECYTFIINDAFGDGICCGFGNGSYELTDDDGNVIFLGGEFSDSEETEISIVTTLGVSNYLTENISIFPNPTTGLLNINLRNLSGDFTYSISNILGQTINKGSLLSNSNTLTINNYNDGIYFMRIVETSTQNFMIKKIVIAK